MKYGEKKGLGAVGVGLDPNEGGKNGNDGPTLGVGAVGVGAVGVGAVGVGAVGVGAVGVGAQFGMLGVPGYPEVEHAVAETPQDDPVSFVEEVY